MSKTHLVPILTVGGCAFGVRILTKYFGARYFEVRPKKKPYWFAHAHTQKKVAHTIPKFCLKTHFPLGFLLCSFLGGF